MIKWYIDTSIWMDIYEDRRGYYSEPLGDYALKLLSMIKAKNDCLIITDLLIRELEVGYSMEAIRGMMLPFEKIIERVFVTKEQRDEALIIAAKKGVPPGDVTHAIIARDNNCVLITRDNHFKKLEDIWQYNKPEEFI